MDQMPKKDFQSFSLRKNAPVSVSEHHEVRINPNRKAEK